MAARTSCWNSRASVSFPRLPDMGALPHARRQRKNILPELQGVARDSLRDHLRLREVLRDLRLKRCTERGGVARIGEHRIECGAQESRGTRRGKEPAHAVLDDLRYPADGCRDYRQACAPGLKDDVCEC